MRWFKVFFILFFLAEMAHASVPTSKVWTPGAQRLYAERRFVELEQIFIQRKRVAMAQNVRMQSQDLYGCTYLHEGHGQESSFQSCLRFLVREKMMQVRSPQRKETLADMNLICERFAEKKSFIDKVFQPEFPKIRSSDWRVCSQALWKQVFLTVHANYHAHPVESLAYMRKAELKLLPDKKWQEKIRGVLAFP